MTRIGFRLSRENGATDLVGIFAGIPDFRVDRTKHHKLEDILVIAACTMICLEGSFTEMEEFGHGIPPKKWTGTAQWYWS